MTAVEILRNEHAIILEALGLLEDHACRLLTGAAPDPAFARWIVEFLREFADDTHHAKEEGVFFGLLERRGFLPDGGALAGARADHAASRVQVDALERAAAAGDPRAFAATALALARALRRHVQREDEELFAKAERLLTPEDDDAALEAFGRVVHERAGVVTRERHLAAIAVWRDAWPAGGAGAA